MVSRLLPKLNVEGSNPFGRSRGCWLSCSGWSESMGFFRIGVANVSHDVSDVTIALRRASQARIRVVGGGIPVDWELRLEYPRDPGEQGYAVEFGGSEPNVATLDAMAPGLCRLSWHRKSGPDALPRLAKEWLAVEGATAEVIVTPPTQ